ncbi:hypothetical protein HID58_037965 [Brassica napus]|uniref:Zinc knuckle CX2CX4HX4C domain-containing protein n=1 Tax=Brassica napus TaxID=3708 RepID=A0ABQ8BN52_BRANA|nr:hypothetical protein HID58_037965 [Brassica napus]
MGIPLHYWTVRNLKNIGKKLGHVDTIELSAGRLLVEVDTRKPLIFNKKVQSPGGDEVTIQFKYEKLFKHCSHCGFLTHEAQNCPKKMEEQRLQAKEAGVFSRVQLPFEPNNRQSLLADRTERDRYHSWNDRKPVLRNERRPETVKSSSSEIAYRPRDDRFMPRYDSDRDNRVHRSEDKRGPQRYSRRYAPYEVKKTQTWRAKDVRDVASRREQRHGGIMQSGGYDDTHAEGLSIVQVESEPSEIVGTSRSSGRKIASTIVTPSRLLSNDGNITFRDRGDPRAITFSPMGNDGYKEDLERGQIIGALQDMEIVEPDGVVVHQQEQNNDMEVWNEQADDLIGEELEEMEEDAVSQDAPVRSHFGGKSNKSKGSSKGSSRSLAPRGMPMRKVEFLRRGSPRKHGVSSSGDPEHKKHNRHTSSFYVHFR